MSLKISSAYTSRTAGKLKPYAGYFCGLAAAAIYGGMAVLGKKIATDLASPLIATSFSLLFGLLITGVLFGRNAVKDGARASKSSWIYILASGGASAFGVSCWYLALVEAPVVIVAPIVAVYPLVTIILTAIFLKNIEKVTPKTISGAALVVTGVILVGLGTA